MQFFVPHLCAFVYTISSTWIVFTNAEQKSTHSFKGPSNIASSKSTYLEVKSSSLHIFLLFWVFCSIVVLFCLAALQSMWDLSSLIRDQTHAAYRGSLVLTTGPL